MSGDIEYRMRDAESEIKHHDEQIAKISVDLGDIKHLIAQIRWLFTGGVLVFVADKVGVMAALGLV
jgi:hypothetical protein